LICSTADGENDAAGGVTLDSGTLCLHIVLISGFAFGAYAGLGRSDKIQKSRFNSATLLRQI
jgi:hypothetical protein